MGSLGREKIIINTTNWIIYIKGVWKNGKWKKEFIQRYIRLSDERLMHIKWKAQIRKIESWIAERSQILCRATIISIKRSKKVLSSI